MTATVETWDRLHSERRHLLNYPNEDVVRFLAALKNMGVEGKGLDVGCGAGRHMLLMREFGFDPVGVDSSVQALEQAATHGETVVADMTDLPFPDNSFDLAVCLGTAYYGDREVLEATLDEIRRVLKPGGYVKVTLRTDRDWRLEAGREVALRSVVLELPGEPEDGMRLTFCSLEDLRWLPEVWGEVKVELAERTVQQLTRLESDFVLALRK